MNRKLLLALRKKNEERLTELRTQLEKGEVREADIEKITQEIEDIKNQLQEIADSLAEDNSEDGTDSENRDGESEDSTTESESEKDEERGSEEPTESRAGMIDTETRARLMNGIGNALSVRGRVSNEKKEMQLRSAFANFVVGNISESEARSLGLEVGNGKVTVPQVIASEVISYAQEENLLRKYGSYVNTDADVKYPVLVKKAEANVRKTERGDSEDIPDTGIEFTTMDLDPTEFDALCTVTKKLLKRTGVNVEQIVIDELKKAYVRKETNFMFKGNDSGNENQGSLEKKAVKFYDEVAIDTSAEGWSQKVYDQLVKFKNQPVTEVLKKSMWIVNRSALTMLERMTDKNGLPLLHPATDGLGYKLLGHNLDFTDAADGEDPTKPVLYFGDFKAFHIQEVKGGMEIMKLVEKYASTNRVGFQIYNLIDGQLIYSKFEPAVYRYEVGTVKPS